MAHKIDSALYHKCMGEVLVFLRTTRTAYTKCAFAEQAGIDPGTYSGHENGANMGTRTLINILNFYEISPDEFTKLVREKYENHQKAKANGNIRKTAG